MPNVEGSETYSFSGSDKRTRVLHSRHYAIRPLNYDTWNELTDPSKEPSEQALENWTKYLQSVKDVRNLRAENRFGWKDVKSFAKYRGPFILAAVGLGILAWNSLPTHDFAAAIDMIAQRDGQGALFLPSIAEGTGSFISLLVATRKLGGGV